MPQSMARFGNPRTERMLAMTPAATNVNTRQCPYCTENIPSGARVCPRCRQWLSWKSLRNPATGAILGVALMFGVLTPLGLYGVFGFSRMFNPRPHYVEYPGAIRVLESRLNWVQTQYGPRIYITGLLTNQSPVAWQSLEFECRFFDEDGTMIDAATVRSYLTVGANDDAAFRAIVVPACPSNSYNSFRIEVSTARNARAPF